jgi:hypothetical protein
LPAIAAGSKRSGAPLRNISPTPSETVPPQCRSGRNAIRPQRRGAFLLRRA